MQRRILTILACFINFVNCFAQSTGAFDKSAAEYPFVYYTPREGLVNNRARFIFQDSKGKLYIGTFGGLSIYDGSRFVNYTANSGLVVDLINDIVEMGEDSVWILSNDYHIHYIRNGQLKEFYTANKFIPLINQLIKCSDGHYYAISDEGLFRFEKNNFIKLPAEGSGIKDIRYFYQAVSAGDKIYAIYNDNYKNPGGRLLVYDISTNKTTTIDTTLYFNRIYNFNGDVWASTNVGLFSINESASTSEHVALKPIPDSFHIPKNIAGDMMYRDRQNNFWISTWTGLWRVAKNGETTLFTTANGLPSNKQNFIFQDRENNMWFTNEQNGVCKLSNQKLAYYPNYKPGYSVTDIFIKPSTDSVWLYDGINKRVSILLPNGNTKEYTYNEPISGNFVTAKNQWLVSGYSIFKWEGDQSGHGHFQFLDSAPKNTMGFGLGYADRKGNLVTVSNYLFVYNGNKLLSAPVNYLADQLSVDKDNRYWVAPRNDQLLCLGISGTGDHEKLSLLKNFDWVIPGSPRSVAADQNGNIWVGSRDQGLFFLEMDNLKIKARHQLNSIHGLSSNFVNYLYCDNENNIWACTPSGVDKVKFENGQFLIENITRGSNLYLAVQKVQQMKNGIVWIFTSAGVVIYKPNKVASNDWKPQLTFSRVNVSNDPKFSVGSSQHLRYFENNLTFQLSAPTFIDEKQTRFSYLLEGSGNRSWSPPSAEASINFVNLPAGKYTLRAKASFLHGRYPDTESSFSFVILPPWWQTWWFKLVVGVVTITLALLALRYYINRKLELQRVILEKRRAIEKERTRIATDMHDDLGAGLSQIKFLSEMIGMRKQKHMPFDEEINSIRSFSHEMIDKMGEIVWALNEKNDTLSDLLSYTRSYAAEYLEQNGIHCVVHEPDNIPPIDVSSEFRRNIYLTVKETLHNIVKHAQATEVIMSFRIAESLIILIKDNGKGIDLATVNSSGNGLISMHNRIEELNGRFDIVNSDGTLVTIMVPFDK